MGWAHLDTAPESRRAGRGRPVPVWANWAWPCGDGPSPPRWAQPQRVRMEQRPRPVPARKERGPVCRTGRRPRPRTVGIPSSPIAVPLRREDARASRQRSDASYKRGSPDPQRVGRVTVWASSGVIDRAGSCAGEKLNNSRRRALAGSAALRRFARPVPRQRPLPGCFRASGTALPCSQSIAL